MRSSFEMCIRDALKQGASLVEIVEILQKWKNNGLTAEEAYESLGEIRDGLDDQTEERILEAMDVASGFCRPELRVWRSD